MPLYEYECAGCGKRFELIQKFSDPPQAACLACGGRAHRLLSPPALQFKGSGWYITDYACKSAPAEKTQKGDGKAESQESAGTGTGESRKAPSTAEKGSE